MSDSMGNDTEDIGAEAVDNSDRSYSDRAFFIRVNRKENGFENMLFQIDGNIKTLKTKYPVLFDDKREDENEIDCLIRNVFPEGFPMNMYAANISYMRTDRKTNEKKLVRYLSIRPMKDGVYLPEKLPASVTLSFRGHLYQGFFVLDQIIDGPESERLVYEILLDNIIPFHTNIPQGRRDAGYLQDTLFQTTSIVDYTTGKLSLWEGYLDWSREIVRRQIAGIKYVDVECDYDKQRLVFTLACGSEDEFKRISRYLKRDIYAFSNEYSKNSWRFDFNDDNKTRRYEKGMELGRFREFSEQGYLEADEKDVADRNRHNGRSYEELRKNIEHPYIVKATYDLSDEDKEAIENMSGGTEEEEEEIRTYIDEDIMPRFAFKNKKNENEIPGGFLATSETGSFVRINRLRMSIDRLKNNETNYSPNLLFWLFDIAKARTPSQADIDRIEIREWLNRSVEHNQHQHQAVKKMLAAPDVCLIQGPPGTGKTTVIAEAVYQFARRGERVLIASQSNDAVDNALARLAATPDIRAIRLEKKENKRARDADESNKFAEDAVLKNFYASISGQISKKHLSQWDALDAAMRDCETDGRNTGVLSTDMRALEKEAAAQYRELEAAQAELAKLQTRMWEAEKQKEDAELEARQLERFAGCVEACTGDGEFNFPDTLYLTKRQVECAAGILNPIINKLLNAGIKICIGKLDTSLLELERVNAIIWDSMRSYSTLTALCKKLDVFEEKAKAGKKVELELLERKRDDLKNKMAEAEEDDVILSLNKEYKKVQQEISAISSSDAGFAMNDGERRLFADFLLQQIENSQNKKALAEDIRKRLAEYAAGLCRVRDELKKTADRFRNGNAETIRRELEKAQANARNIQDEWRDKTTTRENKRKQLEELSRKYNCPVEKISDAVAAKQKQTEALLQEAKVLRDDWEGLLRDFKKRLDDPDTHIYDNDHYLDIYVNACNVVGISCTASDKLLSDKGFNVFDVAIIDEVSKATPPELLIALMKAKKAVLVGDHRQLPPLFNQHEKSYREIISSLDEADETVREVLTEDNFKRYEKMVTASLFKDYFEKAPETIKHSLWTQYRMHSDIMNVINRFYDGKLESGLSKEDEAQKRNHGLRIKGLDKGTFITPERHAYWIDSSRLPDASRPDGIPFYETRPQNSSSAENILECHIIIELLKRMNDEYASQGYGKHNRKSVGIISFYFQQIRRIKEMFKKIKSRLAALDVSINTVDRFQGQEREIVIVSLVRNVKNARRSADSHIAAFERINVAFSRAQELLVITGAWDMYREQPVKLKNIVSGEERTVKVYENILFELHRTAGDFSASKIVSPQMGEEIAEFVEREYR